MPPSCAVTSPACRERGGRWEMRRWEQTSCNGAERWGWILSQANSPGGGSQRGACPAFPAPDTRALTPCQLCLRIPEHAMGWQHPGVTLSKPHEMQRQVSTWCLQSSPAAAGCAGKAELCSRELLGLHAGPTRLHLPHSISFSSACLYTYLYLCTLLLAQL